MALSSSQSSSSQSWSHPSAVSTSTAFEDSEGPISSSWYGTPPPLLLFLILHKAHEPPTTRATRKAK
ncbi:hypothetical protein Hanom_Chr10g00894711 [Helianthus anomalus]